MGSKITQLELTDSPSGADLLALAKNPGASPVSRRVTITSLESALPNRITELGNLGTGIEVFREKSSTSALLRTLVGGENITISSATSTITLANTLAASENHFSFTVGASNTWNNELIPVWQAPRHTSATIQEILATTSPTGSISFNLQHRDYNAMQAAGIDIFAASQTATSATEQLTSFARATIDPRAHIMFTTGSGAESGSVSYLQISVYYTV